MNAGFVRFVCRVLAASMLVLPLQAGAGLVATGQAAANAQLQQAARTTIEYQLQALGISAKDAKDRVAALSDAEAASIAGRIDSVPAGAGGAAVGAILVLIFLVWRFGFSDEAKAAQKEPAKKEPAKKQ